MDNFSGPDITCFTEECPIVLHLQKIARTYLALSTYSCGLSNRLESHFMKQNADFEEGISQA